MEVNCLSHISLSCVALAAALSAVALLARKRKWALWTMTGGVYAALVFLFLFAGAKSITIYSVLIAADYSLDVLTLGYGLKDFVEVFGGTDYKGYALCLFLAAPVLTLSNVLVLFQHVIDKLRYVIVPGKKYILSELNAESLALAESIRKKHYYDQIIFTGVGNPEKKYDSNLLEKARELNALCLKQEITGLRLGLPLRKNMIFLIGRHEPGNVSDALALIEKYKDSHLKIDLYVYAATPESKMAIDAADKGENLLDISFRNYLEKEMKPVLDESKCWDKKLILDCAAAAPLKSSFSVHIVDAAELTVRNILVNNSDAIWKKAKESKTVSITILGFGRHGRTLLKMAVWLFQLHGYRLQINIFDKDGTARRRLQQEAPELLRDFGSLYKDDASHDILFMGGDRGNDCFHSDFDALFQEHWERLKNTQLVFVSLGDDSRNIAAAIHFRELFQCRQIETVLMQVSPNERKEKLKELKKQGKKICEGEMPLICAMVADPARASSLTAKSSVDEAERSRCEYNITPVGSLMAAYDFAHILELMKLEKLALRCHLLWSVKDILSKKDAADANKLDSQGELVKMDSTIVLDNLVKQTQQYIRDSYYRDSSIATAVHQIRMLQLKTEFDEKERTEKCMITEHMRWNAYMRSRGYRQHDVRNDRVKLHPSIVPYHKLSPDEKEKDLVEFNEEEIKCIFPNLQIPQA